VPWRYEQAGDGVVGEVVRVERMASTWGQRWPDGQGAAVVTVRVEAARSGGESIEPGTWLIVYMSASELRRAWEQVGGIEVGDRLVVGYEGQRPYRSSGALKHVFSCGVQRAIVDKEPGPSW
jgi:hypothetical protein